MSQSSSSNLNNRRRGQDSSEESTTSQSSSLLEVMLQNLQLEEKLDPKATLRRFLSVKTVVSTASSYAQRQDADVENQQVQFRSIGVGTCARVFEIPGTTHAIKVAIHPGQETDQVQNDFIMHKRIYDAVANSFSGEELEFRIPEPRFFISKDDSWWKKNLSRFPSEFLKDPSSALLSERILPLAKPIRESLIDEFAPEKAKFTAKMNPANNDCLVRVYLGKRRIRVNSQFFALRNFNMHLDQMESLGLDVMSLASGIAQGLAMMHWACNMDGNDVEFVLGSSPKKENQFKARTTYLWMLDFNRCKKLSPDFTTTMNQLVNSFFINDPYFPRPVPSNSGDAELWYVFRSAYEKTASRCFEKKLSPPGYSQWPRMFMDKVVLKQKQKVASA